MRRQWITIMAAALPALLAIAASPVQARTCTGQELAATVDQTAQTLRSLNADSEKRYQAKLNEIARVKGWNREQINAYTERSFTDPRLAEFNAEIETLVSRIDGLSSAEGGSVSCQRVDDLNQVRNRLLTIMGQKSGYMLAELDAEGARTGPEPQAARSAPLAQPQDPPREAESRDTPRPPAVVETRPDDPPAATPRTALKEDRIQLPPLVEQSPSSPPPVARPPGEAIPGEQPTSLRPPARPEPRSEVRPDDQQLSASEPVRPGNRPGWSTQNEQDLSVRRNDEIAALPPPLPPADGSADGAEDQDASAVFTYEEIQDAGGGLFGAVSSEFGAVISYAFQKYGQPNGYITGDEGGGAFLAGLRYGKGVLYLKNGPTQRIYWQGPSLGVDFGAAGSRVMFLVYKLNNPEKIFGRFSGVDGSAYVAGGIGLTVLKKGATVIVPIRTGIGLRVGASLAYLKFTDRPTWNPF